MCLLEWDAVWKRFLLKLINILIYSCKRCTHFRAVAFWLRKRRQMFFNIFVHCLIYTNEEINQGIYSALLFRCMELCFWFQVHHEKRVGAYFKTFWSNRYEIFYEKQSLKCHLDKLKQTVPIENGVRILQESCTIEKKKNVYQGNHKEYLFVVNFFCTRDERNKHFLNKFIYFNLPPTLDERC